MSEPFFVILVDKATPAQIAAVHAIIKTHAAHWWHRFATCWLVSGLSATAWRDLIREPLRGNGAGTLVLKLANREEKGKWASSGPAFDEKMKWLTNNYSLN